MGYVGVAVLSMWRLAGWGEDAGGSLYVAVGMDAGERLWCAVGYEGKVRYVAVYVEGFICCGLDCRGCGVAHAVAVV